MIWVDGCLSVVPLISDYVLKRYSQPNTITMINDIYKGIILMIIAIIFSFIFDKIFIMLLQHMQKNQNYLFISLANNFSLGLISSVIEFS